MNEAQETAIDRGVIVTGVVEILEGMTGDWDTGFSGRIGADTSLMRDLTFESIDLVMLIVSIEERFGKKGLPFEQLLMVDGRYVDDLKVTEIAAFLEKHLDGGAAA
ncbi:MAG TPA: acyl carrier protein [Candidatus Polarisedimenticolia bacterium]|nr:acyl carrier protein [Candidatus Polarisedimenticolia bacterium]